MVQVGSILDVIDNSGARTVKCLKILGVGGRKYGLIGDLLVVSVRTKNPLKDMKKGSIHKAVLVRVAKGIKRSGGEVVRCMSNVVVLLKAKDQPLGTRIKGPVFIELRSKGFLRVVSQAKGTF